MDAINVANALGAQPARSWPDLTSCDPGLANAKHASHLRLALAMIDPRLADRVEHTTQLLRAPAREGVWRSARLECSATLCHLDDPANQ
jgi:hypothetical protein